MRELIPINKLIVNPENYRFDPVDTQDQAIDLMIEKKGTEIYNLAKHILEYGLDGARDIRVLKQDNVYLVLDGNRRITAVKCLKNPELIKDNKMKSDFEKLPTLFSKEPPKEVNCYVYDIEKDASEWIRLDHTGKNNGSGQDNWGAQEKERFDFKFGGKLTPAMQILNILQSKGYVFNNSKLKISTINRILSYPSSREYLGIDIKQNNVQITGEENAVITRLNALFNQIIDKDVKVAAVYDKDKALTFMKDLYGEPLKPKTQQASLKLDIKEKHKKHANERKLDQENANLPEPVMFVITAFAGLDDVFKTLERVSKELFKKMLVQRVDYVSGARDTQDQKIMNLLETSDYLVAVLSMGEKEKKAYEAIRSSKDAKQILEKYFPINHNVLLELGYGLKCVKGTRKEKDIFIIIEETSDNGLPNLLDFCRSSFFDIRNRGQISYKSISELETKLKKEFKRAPSMKVHLK